jgi:hypothetical protein
MSFLDTVAVGEPVTLFGYYMTVKREHLRPSQLDGWRHEGDPLADAVVRLLASGTLTHAGCPAGEASGAGPHLRPPHHHSDAAAKPVGGSGACPVAAVVRGCPVAELEALAAAGHPAAVALLADVTAVPSWVDWARIRRGQEFYVANAAAAGTCLLNLGLIAGFGASRLNRVLESTAYLSAAQPDIAYRRLLDTLQMVVDVLGEGALRVGGEGWRSVVAVRLLHAAVRVRLVDGGRWDGPAAAGEGVPINQEDMVATQLAFSLVVCLGMERLGVAWHLSDAAMSDYLHLFKYVGHLLGITEVHNGHMDSLAAAIIMLESVLPHLLDPDASTQRLALASVAAVAGRAPLMWSAQQHVAVTRRLAGNLYAEAAGIPRPDDPRLAKLGVGNPPVLADAAVAKAGASAGAGTAGPMPRAQRSSAFATAIARLGGGSTLLDVCVGVLLAATSAVILLALAAAAGGRAAGAAVRQWVRGGADGRRGRSAEEPRPGYSTAMLTLGALQVVPYLNLVPPFHAWLVRAGLRGMHAMLASQRGPGGRTDFRIRHLPRPASAATAASGSTSKGDSGQWATG